jgi:alkylresorcinol/alkylpyrone synthase
MKKYLQNFNVYIGPNEIAQETAVDWLGIYQGLEDKERYRRYAVNAEHISTRTVYASGIGEKVPAEGSLYSLQEESSPNLNKRSEEAQVNVEKIFNALYDGEEKVPSYLNHVSCTHYQSPSAAQKIVIDKEWHSRTVVTHLYHMGCYAALPAVRVSSAYIADGADQVDVVHTELCSLHLNKEDTSAEQIVMNTLFADGAIKYSVTSESHFKKERQDGFEIITQKEVLVSDSQNEMSWKLGSHGFLMTLTKRVPILIAKGIEKYMREIFNTAGLDFERDRGDVIFAVHPGGPKIIELIAKVLKLNDSQVKHSLGVLKKRGNMSSATIPHIWNEIVKDKEVKADTFVATVAFGPGLTMTGAILKLCRH